MPPWFDPAVVTHHNVRSATNEKRLRNQAPGYSWCGISMSPTHLSGAFEAHPIIKISSNLGIKAKVVKAQPENSKMLVLKTRSHLPGVPIRRRERYRSSRFSRSAAGIERHGRILGGRRQRQAQDGPAQYHQLTHWTTPFASQDTIANLFIFTSEFQRVHPI